MAIGAELTSQRSNLIRTRKIASEVKFDIVGQKSSHHLISSKIISTGLYVKEIVLISIIVTGLWTLKIFNFASEVNIDFIGQTSL